MTIVMYICIYEIVLFFYFILLSVFFRPLTTFHATFGQQIIVASGLTDTFMQNGHLASLTLR